jgi:hypothetical protein
MQENQKAEMLRATARKRLKHDRQVAGLHLELYSLHRAHVEWASLIESEERREQECRQKRQQEEQQQHEEQRHEEQQQHELSVTMNKLIWLYQETFAVHGDTFT